MKDQDYRRRWQRLTRLLEPIHEQAARTARHLGRSTGDGDDLYQEAVLRAFRKLSGLRDESRFRSWFFAVLLSVHRSRARRSFWRRFLPLAGPDGAGEEAVPERGRTHEEEFLAARRVSGALAGLPAPQREALVLYEIEGFAMDEIASLQGVTVSAVKSRLARGRKRLRNHYLKRGWAPSAATRGQAPERTEPMQPGSFRVSNPPAAEWAAAFSSPTNANIGKGGRHE